MEQREALPLSKDEFDALQHDPSKQTATMCPQLQQHLIPPQNFGGKTRL